MTYQDGQLEPFTQTAYFALLPPGEQRLYHTKQLEECDAPHWSLRILGAQQCERGRPVGRRARVRGLRVPIFTAEEIVRFPIYVNSNHGDTWNRMPSHAAGHRRPHGHFVFAVPVLGLRRLALCLRAQRPSAAAAASTSRCSRRATTSVLGEPALRELAVAALRAVLRRHLRHDRRASETLFHFFYALRVVGAPGDPQGVGIFLGVVFLFGKVAARCCSSRSSGFTRARFPEFVWRTYDRAARTRAPAAACGSGQRFYSPMWAHGAWSGCSKSSAWASTTASGWAPATLSFPAACASPGIVRLLLHLVRQPLGLLQGRGRRLCLNMNCPHEVTDELREIYNSYYYVAGREAGRCWSGRRRSRCLQRSLPAAVVLGAGAERASRRQARAPPAAPTTSGGAEPTPVRFYEPALQCASGAQGGAAEATARPRSSSIAGGAAVAAACTLSNCLASLRGGVLVRVRG